MENPSVQPEKAKENTAVEEQELLMDFSSMFKSKGAIPRKPKLSSASNIASTTPNWLLQIPAKLDITISDIKERRYLDQRRWMCMTKCNDNNDKCLSAVVSVWNYLFSKKGAGDKDPIKLSQIKELMQTKKIKYGDCNEFERLNVLKSVFTQICKEYSTEATFQVIIKPTQPEKLAPLSDNSYNCIKEGLKSEKTAYIYITNSNIICPIGFEMTPLVPLDAYKKLNEIKVENIENWLMMSSTALSEPPFVIKRWSSCKLDLQTVWPQYFDLDDITKGVQRRPDSNEENEKEERGSSCCIIQIKRS